MPTIRGRRKAKNVLPSSPRGPFPKGPPTVAGVAVEDPSRIPKRLVHFGKLDDVQFGDPPGGVLGPPSPGQDPPTISKRRRGPDKVRRVRKGESPTGAEIEHVARLAAAGESKAGISRATLMSTKLVDDILARPDISVYVTTVRDAIRSTTLEHIQNLQGKVWARVADSVDLADSKEFGAWMEGTAQMEKIAASASGEARPQVAVTNQTLNVDADLGDLLGKLGYSKPPPGG